MKIQLYVTSKHGLAPCRWAIPVLHWAREGTTSTDGREVDVSARRLSGNFGDKGFGKRFVMIVMVLLKLKWLCGKLDLVARRMTSGDGAI
jgi:hypothetical protein